MKRGKGNVPEFAKYMNKKKEKDRAERIEDSDYKSSNTSAKGQNMKNSNASHRTCQ